MTSIRAAALAAALVLAGCGSGTDGLGKRALAAKANAICGRYAAEGRRLTPPQDITDLRQAVPFYTRAHAIAARQQAELERLKPAKAVRPAYESLMRATGAATTLLGQLAAAARAKDADRGSELLQRLQPDSDAVDRAARPVGARSCAA